MIHIEIINGLIKCNGVLLNLTTETIQDYQSQTGMDGRELIEWVYNSHISVIRDKKIDEILSIKD